MTEVNLDLHAEAEGLHLISYGLRARDQSKPVLDNVNYTARKGRKSGLLKIRVPPNQPAGVYTGVLVDRTNGQAHGTLSVRLDADSDSGDA